MSTPARLEKKEDKSYPFFNSEIILGWALAHPNLVFMILFLVASMLFGIIFAVAYNMCTIESGLLRNFLVRGV